MQYLGIGFLVLVFLEIMSIVWMADWIGGALTFLLMIASFAAGVFMLRRTGIAGVMLLGASMRNGKGVSLYQMLWPVRFALAGVLLMSPGFVSMLIALILLLPIRGKPVAEADIRSAAFDPERAQNPFSRSETHRHADDIVDAEYTVTRSDRDIKKQDYIEHRYD